MNEILLNTALWMLNDYCKENGIDCSGTYCVKLGRGFTYALRVDPYSRVIDNLEPVINIATITFHKSQRPTFSRA